MHLRSTVISVLEFELRKAQDTIKSLRSTLTKAAESELSSPERQDGTEQLGTDEPLRAHEKRALNFLVNEYLLRNDYKLTSVTFAEEENQVTGHFLSIATAAAADAGLAAARTDAVDEQASDIRS